MQAATKHLNLLEVAARNALTQPLLAVAHGSHFGHDSIAHSSTSVSSITFRNCTVMMRGCNKDDCLAVILCE